MCNVSRTQSQTYTAMYMNMVAIIVTFSTKTLRIFYIDQQHDVRILVKHGAKEMVNDGAISAQISY